MKTLEILLPHSSKKVSHVQLKQIQEIIFNTTWRRLYIQLFTLNKKFKRT